MSKYDYGTYGQVILITNLLTVALALGLGKVIYIYYSDKSKDNDEVFKSNIVTAFLLGILGLCFTLPFVGIIGDFLQNAKTSRLITIHLLSLPFSIVFISLNASLIYFGKVKESAQIAVLSNILKVLLLLVAVQVFDSLFLIFLSLVFVSLVQCLMGLFLLRNILSFKTSTININMAQEQLKLGVPLGLTAILGVIYKSTDSVMISSLLSVQDYAVYRNGAIEVPFVATLYSSIGAIVLPNISKLYNENNFVAIMNLKRRVITNSIALIFPFFLFIVFYSHDIIVLYLSSKYEASAIIFCIFSFSLLIRVNDYEDIMIVSKKGNYILRIYAVAFIVNVVLNYFLIQFLGSMGAAISTIFVLLGIALVSLVLSAKIIGYKMHDYFETFKIVKIVIVSSAIFLLFYMIIDLLDKEVFLFTVFPIYIMITNFVLIRFGLFDVQVVNVLLQKIPIIGNKINSLLTNNNK